MYISIFFSPGDPTTFSFPLLLFSPRRLEIVLWDDENRSFLARDIDLFIVEDCIIDFEKIMKNIYSLAGFSIAV